MHDARDIADELTAKGDALSLGGSRYDPTGPVDRPLFNVLAMVAEFERDLGGDSRLHSSVDEPRAVTELELVRLSFCRLATAWVRTVGIDNGIIDDNRESIF